MSADGALPADLDEAGASGLMTMLVHADAALAGTAPGAALRRYRGDLLCLDALAAGDRDAHALLAQLLAELGDAALEPDNRDASRRLRHRLSQVRFFVFAAGRGMAVRVVPRRVPGDPDFRRSGGGAVTDYDVIAPGEPPPRAPAAADAAPRIRVVDVSEGDGHAALIGDGLQYARTLMLARAADGSLMLCGPTAVRPARAARLSGVAPVAQAA